VAPARQRPAAQKNQKGKSKPDNGEENSKTDQKPTEKFGRW
jgi:hypothetical protein